MVIVRKHLRKINGKRVRVRKHKRNVNKFKKPFEEMPKNTYHLPIEQAIYVPSTNKKQKFIGTKRFKRRTKNTENFLSKKYGGFTKVEGLGGYALKEKDKIRVIREQANKVTAFSTKKDFLKNRKSLKKFVLSKKKKWKQDSIGLEIEGDLFYI